VGNLVNDLADTSEAKTHPHKCKGLSPHCAGVAYLTIVTLNGKLFIKSKKIKINYRLLEKKKNGKYKR